ncbi:hypothetical protein [Tateyamaria sp.]|uniref:hypothetical protein n=1 Tax=Tateyamaria sp. TaxID=1929288 RepID=UPI0039B8F1E2
MKRQIKADLDANATGYLRLSAGLSRACRLTLVFSVGQAQSESVLHATVRAPMSDVIDDVLETLPAKGRAALDRILRDI